MKYDEVLILKSIKYGKQKLNYYQLTYAFVNLYEGYRKGFIFKKWLGIIPYSENFKNILVSLDNRGLIEYNDNDASQLITLTKFGIKVCNNTNIEDTRVDMRLKRCCENSLKLTNMQIINGFDKSYGSLKAGELIM